MEYFAKVKCNCYKNGLLKSAPPFAEHVKTSEDEVLWLDLPIEENHNKFESWYGFEACEHNFMNHFECDFSDNLLALSEIAEIEPDSFPIIRRYFPLTGMVEQYSSGYEEENGVIHAVDAPELLSELHAIADLIGDGKLIIRNQHVYLLRHKHKHGISKSRGNKIHIQLHSSGLSITKSRFKPFSAPDCHRVFHSKAFTQTRSGRQFLLTDLATGKECRVPFEILPYFGCPNIDNPVIHVIMSSMYLSQISRPRRT